MVVMSMLLQLGDEGQIATQFSSIVPSLNPGINSLVDL